jgi:hypothetical protein
MAKKSHKPKSSKPSRAGQPPRSLDEIQAIKTALWGAPAAPPPPPPRAAAKVVLASHEARIAAAAATGPTLVAEGDSWFDYAPGMDILDNLKYYYHYSIIKLSCAGDTLENMVFGTALGHGNARLACQLETLVHCVATYQPKAVLFSGGGNDIVGEPLEAYINHRDSGILPLLRAGHMNDVLGGLFRSAYQKLAERIWAVRPETHIVTHGYGHPIPDGRGVFNFPFGFHFIGPWLKPAFCKKNILDQADAQGIIAQLIDAFNGMLADVQHLYSTNAQGKFHYIDLRQEIKTADWVNELHLRDEAYRRVAAKFDAALQTL